MLNIRNTVVNMSTHTVLNSKGNSGIIHQLLVVELVHSDLGRLEGDYQKTS